MILRLGHVELLVEDLESAEEFYVELLGFDVHSRSDSQLRLRALEEFDSWSLCLTLGSSAGLGHTAYRVSAESDLAELATLHGRLGLPCKRVPAGTEPGQGEALRVLTPDGLPVEFYHQFDEVEIHDGDSVRLPMRSLNGRSGVPPARLDHVNFRVPDTPAAMEYWVGELGFQASEVWLEPDGSVRTAWVRRAQGTHDVALGRGEPAIHHVAYTVADQTLLVRTADLLGDAGLASHLEFGPSRHGATNAFCMYVRDPTGNRLELYTGDYFRDLDRPPIRWSAEEYAAHGHSWWGQQAGESFREASPVATTDWLDLKLTPSHQG